MIIKSQKSFETLLKLNLCLQITGSKRSLSFFKWPVCFVFYFNLFLNVYYSEMDCCDEYIYLRC